MYSERFLKTLLKLLTSPFLVMLQTSFTQGSPKGKLGSQSVLQGHLGTRAFVGHLGTRAHKVFGILDTRAFAALEHLKDTRALIALEEIEAPHLANSHKNSFSTEHCSLLKTFYENWVPSKYFCSFMISAANYLFFVELFQGYFWRDLIISRHYAHL